MVHPLYARWLEDEDEDEFAGQRRYDPLTPEQRRLPPLAGTPEVVAGVPPEALYAQPSPESLGRSPGPYGAGSPGERPDLRPALGPEDYEGLLQFGDDVSTRQLTPGELRTFPAGFQAIATPDERPALPEKRPPPFAEQSAQELFGKAYAALAPPQQQMALQGAARDANQQASYEYSIQRPDLRGPPPRALRAPTFAKAGKTLARDKAQKPEKPMTEYQREQARLSQGRLDLARERQRTSKAGRRAAAGPPQPGRAEAPRPPGTVADPESERLQNIVRETLGVDELSPAWNGRITAIRNSRRKDRPRMETALIKDAKREWKTGPRGGVQADPAKRAQQVKDFEEANVHTGLKVRVAGRYTDMINKRGSAKVETEIQTTNRAMHASARLIELDTMYGEIPIENLAERFISAEGRAIADEYDFLRDEHMGIILRISGQGMGDAQSRQHIRDGLPDIRTTWSFRSQPRLVGLHRMLVVNGKANLMNMGIEIHEPGIGSMNVYHPKKAPTEESAPTEEPTPTPTEPDYEVDEDEDDEWEEL